MPVQRDDPYGAYNFEVTVNGVSDDGTAVKGSFTEVTLADTEVNRRTISVLEAHVPLVHGERCGLSSHRDVELGAPNTGDAVR